MTSWISACLLKLLKQRRRLRSLQFGVYRAIEQLLRRIRRLHTGVPLLLLPLVVSLSLELLDHLGRAILHELTVLVDTSPLRETIWDVHHALAIEHVASITVFSGCAIAFLLSGQTTHCGLNLALASSVFKCIRLGNSRIMFLPSSMIGLLQKLHRTLHGN